MLIRFSKVLIISTVQFVIKKQFTSHYTYAFNPSYFAIRTAQSKEFLYLCASKP